MYRPEKVMELTHIIQSKAKLRIQREENHQRILTRDNGKPIPSMALVNKHTQVSVLTTDIGRTERGMEKEL